VARVFATLSFYEPRKRTYDLQLDHWGICRYQNETFSAMRERLESDNGPVWAWLNSNHNGLYDNSIEGVHRLNLNAARTLPGIYYFSFSFHSTSPFPTIWPPWTLEAIGTFPISMVEFIRRVLESIHFVDWIIDQISQWLVRSPGWSLFSSMISLKDVVRWATEEVGNRLLHELGYDVKLPLPGEYVPRKDVLPLLLPVVYAIGGQPLSHEQRDILGPKLGDWGLNDGVVNTESMRGPDDSVVRSISSFSPLNNTSTNARGVYWDFGLNDRMDHSDEIGVFVEETTVSSLSVQFDTVKTNSLFYKGQSDERDVHQFGICSFPTSAAMTATFAVATQ
jgi:hypothetical protein